SGLVAALPAPRHRDERAGCAHGAEQTPPRDPRMTHVSSLQSTGQGVDVDVGIDDDRSAYLSVSVPAVKANPVDRTGARPITAPPEPRNWQSPESSQTAIYTVPRDGVGRGVGGRRRFDEHDPGWLVTVDPPWAGSRTSSRATSGRTGRANASWSA